MNDDPATELEDAAAELRQNAWLLGEFWQACRDAGLPEGVAHEVVTDYHRECLLLGDEIISRDGDD